MHDCTATALSYGIYKTDFPTSGPNCVLFIDIVHCDTQVSIASFEAGDMRIWLQAVGLDRSVSSLSFLF